MKESFWEAVQEHSTPSGSLERSFSDFVGSAPKNKGKRKDPPRSLATRAFQKDARDVAILNRAVQWGRDQKVKEESLVEEMEQLETQLLLALNVLRIYTVAQATFEIPVCLLYLSVCLLSPFIRGLLCDVFLALTSFMLTPRRQFEQKKTKQLLSALGVVAGISVFNCCTQVADGVVMMFTVADTFTCRCKLSYEVFCLGIERYLPFLHLLYIPLLLVILKQRSRLRSMLERHDELTLALQTLRDQRLSQEMAFFAEDV